MRADELNDGARGDESRPGQPATADGGESPSREERERQEAWRRGEAGERRRTNGEGAARSAHPGLAPGSVAARAFAALAENVRDYAIFLLDPDGVITFWGEGARLIKWWTKNQAEGAHLRLLYPPGGSEDGTAEEHLRESAERGEYTGEGHRMRSDGSTFWAGVTLTALWDEDGTLLGFAKVTRDLTARRAADALLQAAATSAEQARVAAEAANAAKSSFLATMSHEIRTPLNAIVGYLDLLAQGIGGVLTDEQQRYLGGAERASGHLLTLIDEVLDLSRLEVDQRSVEHAVVRVGDAVGHALGLVTPQARAKGLDLTDAVSGHAAGLAAWGDEGRVQQILVNLLGNAVKFTAPRGGEPARVMVSAGGAASPSPDAQVAGDGPWVYIRVEDTGRGIPADRLAAIFDPFVQVDMTLTRPHGGAGLGLAISRRLARLMGGDVTVRSELGVGSTFFLWLPAAPAASLETGGLPGHGPGGEADPSELPPSLRRQKFTPSGASPIAATPADPLRELSDILLAELERVLHAYVARLRSDPATPSAHVVDEALIEDHLASFLADLAGTLDTLGAPGDSPAASLRDGSTIQRAIADRHGAQRARLGWTERELRREFTVLREELASAIRRRGSDRLRTAPADGGSEAGCALDMLERLVSISERRSVDGLRKAADTRREDAAPKSSGG